MSRGLNGTSVSVVAICTGMLVVAALPRPVRAPDTSAESGAFSLAFDTRGLNGLAAAADPYAAQILALGSRLGIVLKYRVEGGDWLDLYQNDPIKSETAAGTTTSAGVFRLELDRDGFAAETPIAFDKTLTRVAFTLENRTTDAHTTVLAIASPSEADRWDIRVDGRRVTITPNASTDYPLRADIPMGTGSARVEMIRR